MTFVFELHRSMLRVLVTEETLFQTSAIRLTLYKQLIVQAIAFQ